MNHSHSSLHTPINVSIPISRTEYIPGTFTNVQYVPCCGPQGESHIRGTHSAGRGMHTPGRDPPFVQVLGGDSTLGSYQEAPHVLWGDSSVSSVTARAMEGLAGRSQYVDDMMKAASMHIKYPPQTSLRRSAD